MKLLHRIIISVVQGARLIHSKLRRCVRMSALLRGGGQQGTACNWLRRFQSQKKH